MVATSVGTLIVGAGQAGVQLALSLRKYGYEPRILIVGEEHDAPYQRPPLSKTFFRAGEGGSLLAFRADSVYAKQGIELHLGDKVTSVDHERKIATLESGEVVAYEHLALTVGGAAKRFDRPGAAAEDGEMPRGMYSLRTAADARALRAALTSNARVAVIGGGFIGLEFAASARELGHEVTVLVAKSRILSRVAPPAVSQMLRDAHTRRGVQIRLNCEIERVIVDDGAVSAIELRDGSVVPCDIVLVGIGLAPRSELAESLGLTCLNGAICVDDVGRTSVDGIVAAGDCTTFVSWVDGEYVTHESVSNAVDQAKVAAATIAGVEGDPRPEPWFWSDQYDLRLQSVGITHPDDDVEIDVDADAETIIAVHRRNGAVRAVTTVNHPREFMRARKDLSQFSFESVS